MKKIKIDTKSKLVLENIDGFVKRKVTKFGNSAKVDCPKEHLGKGVFLVFIKNETNKD